MLETLDLSVLAVHRPVYILICISISISWDENMNLNYEIHLSFNVHSYLHPNLLDELVLDEKLEGTSRRFSYPLSRSLRKPLQI